MQSLFWKLYGHSNPGSHKAQSLEGNLQSPHYQKAIIQSMCGIHRRALCNGWRGHLYSGAFHKWTCCNENSGFAFLTINLYWNGSVFSVRRATVLQEVKHIQNSDGVMPWKIPSFSGLFPLSMRLPILINSSSPISDGNLWLIVR